MIFARKNYPHLAQPVGPYVQAVKHDGLLFLSGLTALGASAPGRSVAELSVAEQMGAICQALASIARSERTDLTSLVKVTLFVTNLRFVRDLRARHLAPDRRSDLLAMALLGVTRGLIDGLAREGVSPSSADEVIAAAALEVTPEYVASLRGAGLTLAKLDDAVACKALDVDAAYVRSLAEAGVHADAEQVVAMKAVGVTPEYARRMADAAQD